MKKTLGLVLVIASLGLRAAETNSKNSASDKNTNSSVSTVFEVTTKTKASQIRKLPDDQLVKLKNGRQVPARNLKSFFDSIKNANKNTVAHAASAKVFSNTQSSGGLKVMPGYNFSELSKRPGNTVIQLPSGRKLTVDDYKKLDAISKARTGKSFADLQPNSLIGPTIKIKSKADLDALKNKPDSTIVENQMGRKITLGTLRKYAQKNNKEVGVK